MHKLAREFANKNMRLRIQAYMKAFVTKMRLIF